MRPRWLWLEGPRERDVSPDPAGAAEMPLVGSRRIARRRRSPVRRYLRAGYEALDVRLTLDGPPAGACADVRSAASRAAASAKGEGQANPWCLWPSRARDAYQHVALEHRFMRGPGYGFPASQWVQEEIGMVSCTRNQRGEFAGYASGKVFEVILNQLGLRLREALDHVAKVRYGLPRRHVMRDADAERVAEMIAGFPLDEIVYLMNLPRGRVREGEHVWLR